LEIVGNGKKFFYNELLRFQKNWFEDAPESVIKRVSKIGDAFAQMDKQGKNYFFSKVGLHHSLTELLKSAEGYCYYRGGYNFLGSFDNDEYQDHRQVVKNWLEKTGNDCLWCTYNGDQSKRFWDMYVKGDTKMVLIEGDVFLFSAIVEPDGRIATISGKPQVLNNEDKHITDEFVLGKIQDTIYKNI
jgi:hypothetical protein